MSMFWAGLAILVAIALLLIAYPWLRATRVSAQHQRDSLNNVQIVRQRLEELEREVAEGLLSEADKQQAIDELKLALVDESASDASDEPVRPAKSRKVLTFGFILALVCGGWVYYDANQIGKLTHWQTAMIRLPELGERVVMRADTSITVQDLEDFALGIRTRLIDKPDDPTAWLLLGRIYASLQQMDSALQAFEKSLAIKSDNPGTLNSYGQALIMTGDEGYMRKGSAMLKRLLQLEPDNIQALSLLAVVSVQLGNNPDALIYLQSLQRVLPQDSELQAEVANRIAMLSAPAEQPNQDETAATGFEVQVSIAENLKEKLPQSGFLFVFAQDASGKNRMPAAVVKIPLSGLPYSVSLTDANAMVEGYTLSALQQVRLVARISQDENVATVAGELEGNVTVQVESGHMTAQQIVIDKEIM